MAQTKSLRDRLDELEKSLAEFSPLMTGTAQRAVDKAIKYGAVFAEVSSPV